MKALWCEQAWLESGEIAAGVRAEFDERGVVRNVITGTEPGPDDLRLDGVVFPAAANAHSHAFHRVLRGRTHTGTGTFWTWREAMYRAAGVLTPELYEELATAVYTEMVTAGWTSVAEFHYVHHRQDGTGYGKPRTEPPTSSRPQKRFELPTEPARLHDDGPHAMELALARAAVTAGIRLTLLDTCYLSSGFGAPVLPEQARFTDGSAEAWLTRWHSLRTAITGSFDASQVSVGAALHSVRAVDEPALAHIAQHLPADVPLHIHLSEQPAENRDCVERTGTTPAGLLAKHHLLSERLTVVHATHLTAQDVELLGQARVTVAMCPTTEADLADGIGPAHALQDAGAVVALGTDQHAVVDPWLEMRALEHGERLASGRRGRFSPAELVRAAASGGARSQGRPAAGLAPGRVCDLVALDPRTARTAGSSPAQLVLTATAQDVTAVVVGGEVVARNGHHTRLGDPGTLLAAAIARMDAAAAPSNAPPSNAPPGNATREKADS
ncbi:formimidoylglutamate deiminase [Arthrobacter tumbae]|uniref:amidohydrolase family protein n=1 Tax=Arthrobacter tumbae TaxID=163874 RepID=UPI001959A2EA|nr:amidohydrolase family protein [Arthrobacter tumbae]MBM7782651.1 formiminoglutamate deiminase [Arthrobacter tumbae]